MTRNSAHQKGFTVVEVTIVIAAAGIIFGLVFSFFWEYWRYAERAQADNDVLVSRLDASDYVRDVIGTSSGLITQNSIADSNASPSDATAGTNYWQTIHAIPKTVTVNSSANEPVLYFKRFSQDSSKSFIMNGSNPYEDEYVIYLNPSGELRARTLKNNNASGNMLATTCPPATATPTCPPDKLLIDNVESISLRYFSRSGTVIDYTPTYDSTLGAWVNGPDYPVVEVVEMNIKVAKKAFTESSNTTQSETVIRIALRNT